MTDLRNTQHGTEVLLTGTPSLRVTQQGIEVLLDNKRYLVLTQQGVEVVMENIQSNRRPQIILIM